jgi:AraC-like DNA-binding protein
MPSSTIRSFRTVRRFEQLIEANPDKPLSMRAICMAIGVADRTLRLYCQEHLAMSPGRYLWLRRMHLARRALALADPAVTTVTAIANDHGFAELGRFAVAYRRHWQVNWCEDANGA